MPATSYRIWGWGQQAGGGVTDSVYVGVSAVAKPAPPDNPMELVNEIVCGDLGRAILLPIPPGVIIRREADRVWHHASLNFSQDAEKVTSIDSASPDCQVASSEKKVVSRE